tara:strand:- start:612157 stop:612840 length:684 start_codon:yes stop_codon:yes gene_type:complete
MSEIEDRPPWSVYYRVDRLRSQRDSLKIEALPEDLEAVAHALNAVKVEGLYADVKVNRPNNNHLIYVSGTLYADVEQECVRSLKPVHTHVEEPFEGYFTDTNKTISFEKGKTDIMIRYGQDEVPMLDEKDDPTRVVDGVINLGELVMQFLTLAVPLYPRAEDAYDEKTSNEMGIVFDDEVDKQQDDNASKKYSPFKELENWRASVVLKEDEKKTGEEGKNAEKDDKK